MFIYTYIRTRTHTFTQTHPHIYRYIDRHTQTHTYIYIYISYIDKTRKSRRKGWFKQNQPDICRFYKADMDKNVVSIV